MDGKAKRNIILGAVAALAVAGGGGAVAATQLGSPREESQAILNDAARQLGIEPSKLSDALKNAFKNRVDAAVAAGRLTKEQGDALKARIDAAEYPLLFGGRKGFGFGEAHFGHLADLSAAASYLDVSAEQLRNDLHAGKTLAQIARDKGKSVDGLVDAMLSAAKKRLDAEVSAGRLTEERKQSIVAGLERRITDFVNGVAPLLRPHHLRGGGFFFRSEGFGPGRPPVDRLPPRFS